MINLQLPRELRWTRHALLSDVEVGAPVALVGDDARELAECVAAEREAFVQLVARLERELAELTAKRATPLVDALLSGTRAHVEQRLRLVLESFPLSPAEGEGDEVTRR